MQFKSKQNLLEISIKNTKLGQKIFKRSFFEVTVRILVPLLFTVDLTGNTKNDTTVQGKMEVKTEIRLPELHDL